MKMKDLLIGNPQKRFYYNVYFGSLPTVGLAETVTLIKLKVGNSKKFTNEKNYYLSMYLILDNNSM